ncbi:hypothetical protein ES703_73360 [subsurface metagenome]
MDIATQEESVLTVDGSLGLFLVASHKHNYVN